MAAGYCYYVLYNMQWRYSIRLENLQKQRVQLRERHWRIFSSSGTLETAKGRGVIGQVSNIVHYLAYISYKLLTLGADTFSKTASIPIQ